VKYSLLSRFQGGLLGSLVGETLARQAQKAKTITVSDLKLSPWSQIASDLSDRLLAFGNLSIDDWEQIYQQYQNFFRKKAMPRSDAIALAVLPLLFFFHEDSDLLKNQLQPLSQVWLLSEEILEDVCIVGYTISLALKERLDSEGAIAQILTRYRGTNSLLIQQLEQFQTFLVQKASLEEIILKTTRQANLKNSSFPMALYCFSYTPEDLPLSLLRAARVEQPTIAPLTGALAGAYNSLNGIPLGWRVAIGRHPLGHSQAQQIKKIFSLWSGAYQSDRSEILESMAIASPSAIQPRPSLKIISQGEYLLTKSSRKVNSNVINKVNDYR
jgi:hypothetical protein